MSRRRERPVKGNKKNVIRKKKIKRNRMDRVPAESSKLFHAEHNDNA